MGLTRLAALALALVCSRAFAEETLTDVEPPPAVGWYVPRYVWLGSYVKGTLSATGHLGWEWHLLRGRRDHLNVLLELGGAWAIGRPNIVGSFYEHQATLGGGYRMDVGRLQWGFSVVTGILFYGGRVHGRGEDFVQGVVEGRAQAGWRIGNVVVGASIGYSEPYGIPPGSLAILYVGGVNFGLFAGWY